MATRRNPPSFFKLHEGDQFSNKLKIPKKILQHFHGNVPRQCRLQTPARTWRVDVEEINNKFYFRKGWNQFVHEIGFKYGELLILHYAGNSDFHVDIFGTNTCQRLIVMPKMEEADDVSLEILDDSPLSSPLPHESNKTSSRKVDFPAERERGGTSRTQKHEHLWRAEALERAKTFKFENPSSVLVSMKPSYVNPSFWIAMSPLYVKGFAVKIPRKFLQHFHGNVPRQCYLQAQARTWPVDVEEVNNKFYFRKGWNQFVHENGLTYGELLIFYYAGNSDFHVDIFGKSTCKKLIVMPKMEEADDVSLEILDDSPLSSPLPHKSNIPADILDNDDDDKEDDDVDDDFEEDEYDDKEDDEVDDDSEEDEYDDDSEEDEYDDDYEHEADSEDEDESNSDDSIEVLDEFPPWLKAKSMGKSSLASGLQKRKRNSSKTHGKSNIRRAGDSSSTRKIYDRKPKVPRQMSGNKEVIALERARNFRSKSVNPSFRIVISPSHFERSWVHIPLDFSSIYLNKQCSLISLRVNERTMSVGIYNVGKLARLQSGWSAFLHGNKLKEGDVCVFVLTDSIRYVFDVKIFRAT